MQKFKMRLNKFRAKFPYRSLLQYVCTCCSQETIVVTMDGFWGPLALFSWVKGFFFVFFLSLCGLRLLLAITID